MYRGEMIKAIPETIEPAMPLRQKISKYTNGIRRICGRGSQIPPSCANPGVRLSTTRLAIFRWDSASPYAVMYLFTKAQTVAKRPARNAKSMTQSSGLYVEAMRGNIRKCDFLITKVLAMVFVPEYEQG